MQIDSIPMEDQRDLLEKEINRWRGKIEQVDDICVIGLRINRDKREIFTDNELEIIENITSGKSMIQMADLLSMSVEEVAVVQNRIFVKSNTQNKDELTLFCKVHNI